MGKKYEAVNGVVRTVTTYEETVDTTLDMLLSQKALHEHARDSSNERIKELEEMIKLGRDGGLKTTDDEAKDGG